MDIPCSYWFHFQVFLKINYAILETILINIIQIVILLFILQLIWEDKLINIVKAFNIFESILMYNTTRLNTTIWTTHACLLTGSCLHISPVPSQTWQWVTWRSCLKQLPARKSYTQRGCPTNWSCVTNVLLQYYCYSYLSYQQLLLRILMKIPSPFKQKLWPSPCGNS